MWCWHYEIIVEEFKNMDFIDWNERIKERKRKIRKKNREKEWIIIIVNHIFKILHIHNFKAIDINPNAIKIAQINR